MVENIPALWSLAPALIVIILALTTRQVILSLLVGIWTGYVVLAGGNPLEGSLQSIDAAVAVFESAGNVRIIIFTLIVGALIALIQRSGGVAGFVNILLRQLDKTAEKAASRGQRRKVELLAVLTGMLLFIESNISMLTVGTLYRPVFDRLGVPREKLAYIADTTCAPSCILLPFNAWGAYIIGLLATQNVEGAGQVFVGATLMNVYPIFAVLLLIGIILTGKDYGEMGAAERRARDSGALLRDGAKPVMSREISEVEPADGIALNARNMVLPILVMVILMPVFLAYTGWAESGGNVLKAMQSGSGSKSVLYATSFAILFAVILYKASGLLNVREMFDLSMKGVAGMIPVAVLLVLAFALGNLCREMGTGQFIADSTSQFMSPALMPAMVFLIACFIAFSTGTSWGTFAIMIAIAVPLANQMDLNMALVVSAAIGGGIFGDHCSPTSDTSIISSMATGNDHIDHVRTQLPYALTAGGAATAFYLIAGFAGI